MASKELIASEIERLTKKDVDTYRGIAEYHQYSGLTFALFTELISQTTVLDICSGLSGLALECFLDGINLNIVSISPGSNRSSYSLSMANHLSDHRRADLKRIGSPFDIVNHVRQNIHARHPADTGLPDGKFDIVFDFHGFNFYSAAMPEDLYLQSLLETFRVLAPGGVFYIRDHKLVRSIRINDVQDLQYQTFNEACNNSGFTFCRVPGTNHTLVVTREE